MRRQPCTPIEMERHACRPGKGERLARNLLIVACVLAFFTAVAMALGYVPHHAGGWPL